MSEHFRLLFPGLQSSPFQVTRPTDRHYNCIAWAADDAKHWWWPVGAPPRTVWPPTIGRELSLDVFAAVFHTVGYVSASDEALELGFEKVASSPTPPANPHMPPGSWPPASGRANWAKARTSNSSCTRWRVKSTAPSP